MQIESTGAALGAIATGVDVTAMSEDEWNALYQAWLDHNGVLVVRGQNLSIPEFLAHGRRFGDVKPHFVKKSRHPEYPELTVMGEGTRHADGSVSYTHLRAHETN